jgi:hypothetical protein
MVPLVLLAAVFQRQLIYLPDRTIRAPRGRRGGDARDRGRAGADGLVPGPCRPSPSRRSCWPPATPATARAGSPRPGGSTSGGTGAAARAPRLRRQPRPAPRTGWWPMPGRPATTSMPVPTSTPRGSPTSASRSAPRWSPRSRPSGPRRRWCCGRPSRSSPTSAGPPTRSCRSGRCCGTVTRPPSTWRATTGRCWWWRGTPTASCRRELSREVARTGRRDLVEVAGAGHNDAALFVGEAFLDAVDEHLRAALAAGATTPPARADRARPARPGRLRTGR